LECALPDIQPEEFEKTVFNQLYRTVNHAELPRAVRKVLCHYMGNGDQVVNTVEDENIQVAMGNNRCLICAA
jgi:hypothetical protein